MNLRLTLRQLSIEERSDAKVEIGFRCKICNCFCSVLLTKMEWFELEADIPFQYVFSRARLAEVSHLKKGLCKTHGVKE